MTRLVYPSISLEGKAFWILITAPIDRTRLILAKFFCWLPLIVIISCSLLAAGILAIHFTWLMFAASLYVGLCLSIGCTGLALGIGGIFASFEWESPTQIASGFGTLVLLLCSLALVVGTFLPASGLMFLCGVTATRNIVGPALAPYAGALLCLLIFALNAGVAGYCCLRGAQSLEERNLGR